MTNHYAGISINSSRLSIWLTAGMLALTSASVALPAMADGVSAANQNLASWVNAKGVSPQMHEAREVLGRHFEALGKDRTLAEQRNNLNGMFADNVSLPADLAFTSVNEDGIKGEWSQGKQVRQGAVLYYLHGGGFSMGTAKAWRAVSAVLGDTAGIRTFSLDYPLAPEHPFPAALDNAVAGYKWLLKQGYSPRQIIIAGDSAGGGMALSTVLKLKAEKQPLPAGIYLLSPWTDMTLSGNSMQHPLEYDPFNQLKSNEHNRALYMGDHNRRDPYASPLFGDFHGLPPILTQVGDNEAYLDDSLRLARRAMRDSVAVTVETWPHVFHVWQGWAPRLPAARDAMKQGARFINHSLDQAASHPD